jgi:hypothetical protein
MMGARIFFCPATFDASAERRFLNIKTPKKNMMPSPENNIVKSHKRSIWIFGALISVKP